MFPSDNDFESKVTFESERNALPDEIPFHILLLGDWNGSKNNSLATNLSSTKPIEIDRDNFEEVFQRLKPNANLIFPGSDQNLALNFDEFDDFHPDRIFQKHSLFSELRTIRQNLKNQNTFESAAREVRSWFSSTDKNLSDEKSEVSSEEAPRSGSDLFAEILSNSSTEQSNASKQTTDKKALSDFIKNIVKPHLVQIDTAEQSKLLLVVDEIISDLMRKILHHPDFQALEAAWRGIFFLVRRVETNSELKIFLYNLEQNNLLDDLKNNDDLTDSLLYRVLDADNPWSVVGGNYTFSANVNDIAGLMRIAKIAENFDCPFIANMTPEIFGIDSFENSDDLYSLQIDGESKQGKLWQALKSASESAYLGLTMPRFLARLPYGAETEPAESFYFEEFTDKKNHRDYLWSNPMFVWITLLAKTFSEYGLENISSRFIYEVDGLHTHFYREDNEMKSMPSVEISMTQKIFEELSKQGLMTIASYKNSDQVKLGQFQSIISPPSILKGRWN